MSTTSPFIKHVSFDNLAPTFLDDQIQLLKKDKNFVGFNNHYIRIPPQYNPLYYHNVDAEEPSSVSRNVRPMHIDLNLGFNSTTDAKIHDMYGSLFSTSPREALGRSISHEVPTRERSQSPFSRNEDNHTARLPPPPTVPSIKNKSRQVDKQEEIADINIADMDFQIEKDILNITNDNTVKNSGSHNGFTQAAFSNLNELEDRIDNSRRRGSKILPKATGKPKRKSFVNMTDEELAELENSYKALGRSAHKNTVADFDFSEQNTLFIGTIPSKNNNVSPINTHFKDPFAAIYSTRPCVTQKAITLTKMHKDYKSLIKEKDNVICHQDENLLSQKFQNLSVRTILCYISGRRYTWSSVDWFIKNQVREGDHIVIVSSIPEYENSISLHCRSSSSSSPSSSQTFTNSNGNFPPSSKGSYIYRNSLKNTDDYSENAEPSILNSAKETLNSIPCGIRLEAIHDKTVEKAKEILEYYISKVSNLVTKVTVEIIKDQSPKNAINHAMQVYKPDWQIVSTVSANLQIKFRNRNVKLPFYMMKHCTIPTCIIPYEFLDPDLLDKGDSQERKKQFSYVPEDKRVWLDSALKKTLKNPFLQTTKCKETDEADDLASINSEDDETVDSLDRYYPVHPQVQRKIDLFEKIGYVRPKLTRQDLLVPPSPGNSKLEPTTSRSSGRSSRIQFHEEGVYQVKSLIDDLTLHSKNDDVIRKTKSVGAKKVQTSSKHSKKNNKNILSKTSSNASGISPLSSKTNTGAVAPTTKQKQQKKKFTSFFKKFF